MSIRAIRLGGVAAIVFVILIVAGGFLANQPMADDSATKIRNFMVDHRGALLAMTLLGLFAVPFALWFVVVLREVLRGDAAQNALTMAMVLALALTGAMALAGGAVAASAAYLNGTAAKLGDDTIRIVWETQGLLFSSTAPGTTAFGAAAALAIRRSGALPAYTMWLAVLAAVAGVVSMFAVLGAGASGLGFISFVGFALFSLVTGITMATGKVRLPVETVIVETLTVG